jgi:hypothetical protein
MDPLPRITARYGLIHRVYVLVEPDGCYAFVEESSDWNRWWVVHLLHNDHWEELIGFRSYGSRTLLPIGSLYADIVDMAPAVDFRYPVVLVIERNEEYCWWLVYLECPEAVTHHVVPFYLVRTFQLNLNSVPDVELRREEYFARDRMEEEEDAGLNRGEDCFDFSDSD